MVKKKEKETQGYLWVETDRQLREILKCCRGIKAVGVDMEMDSMFHFKEKICLIQMATPENTFLIDPLRIRSMKPLKPLFEDDRVKKIIHGADYDIRSLFRDFKIEIRNLFDTQLASRFVGVQQTGLESVLNERFNVALDKRYQKKDWSQRPLPEYMVTYAAKDACHLIPLARVLEKELRQKKRLSWVKEECEWLSRVRPAVNGNEPLFLGFKGAGRLKPGDLVVLEALLQYRRKVAMSKDRPLFKTFNNSTLLTLANQKPVGMKQLKETRALSSRQIKLHGRRLLDTIEKVLKVPSEKHPVYPRRRTPGLKPVVSNRIKTLKIWRDAKAEALGIDPALVLNKTLICAIAKTDPVFIKQIGEIQGIHKWRTREFGREIVELLKGMRRV